MKGIRKGGVQLKSQRFLILIAFMGCLAMAAARRKGKAGSSLAITLLS